MRTIQFASALLFISIAGSADAGQQNLNELIFKSAANGAKANLMDAPKAELDQCLRLLPVRIGASRYKKFRVLKSGGTDYVLFVSWGVGWDSLMVSYVAEAEGRGGVFIYEDEDGRVNKGISRSEVEALISKLSINTWTYSYIPGVQDGSCQLLLLEKAGREMVVLIPPGGAVNSGKGDPRESVAKWIDSKL